MGNLLGAGMPNTARKSGWLCVAIGGTFMFVCACIILGEVVVLKNTGLVVLKNSCRAQAAECPAGPCMANVPLIHIGVDRSMHYLPSVQEGLHASVAAGTLAAGTRNSVGYIFVNDSAVAAVIASVAVPAALFQVRKRHHEGFCEEFC